MTYLSNARPSWSTQHGSRLQSLSEFVGQVNRWTVTEMTALNQNILDGRRPAQDLARDFQWRILAGMASPEEFTPDQAKRLVVLFGLAGASVGRHFQEQDPAHREHPERAFSGLAVGVDGTAFPEYFEQLAARTATGHGARDSYASLVRWNLPTAEIWWSGERVAQLPGVFTDGQVRTYTGTSDERRFFRLLKMSEALESAVNVTLMPLSEDVLNIGSEEAVERIARAVVLLTELRRLNTDFAALPPQDGLRPDYFLDVFRQYAVHWKLGDVPPSGALDPEAVARDLLLGIVPAGYQDRVQQLFPGFLDAERSMLTALMTRPSLPGMLMRLPGLDLAVLAESSPEQLMAQADRQPVIAALYLLLNAHARLSGVHLMLSKKFLFTPQRAREQQGAGDPGVVSNRRGTTGMDESHLERLTRARQNHPLAMFRHLPAARLEDLAGMARVRAAGPVELRGLAAFADDDIAARLGVPVLIRPRAAPDDLPVQARYGAGHDGVEATRA